MKALLDAFIAAIRSSPPTNMLTDQSGNEAVYAQDHVPQGLLDEAVNGCWLRVGPVLFDGDVEDKDGAMREVRLQLIGFTNHKFGAAPLLDMMEELRTTFRRNPAALTVAGYAVRLIDMEGPRDIDEPGRYFARVNSTRVVLQATP